LLIAVLALLSLPAGVRAQDARTASGWSFQITPYLWLAGIGGDVTTARGLSASFSQSIGDVLSDLDGGLMILGEVRYRRWGLLADFDYARLSTNGDQGLILGQAGLTTREYIGTLDGGYRFVDSDSFKLDGLMGVRVFSIDNSLSFSGGLLPPRSDSGGDTWADPLIGLRAILPIGAGFFGNAYGDVGGGPNGDLTWQIYGGLGYNISETVAAYVGYRYLAFNHAVDNLTFDIHQQGPLLGVGIRF
jgi:opacity protein-like surface antigen